jgi:hypothetical protein
VTAIPDPTLLALRRIGWEVWDPIGLAHHVGADFISGPADEYDRYLLEAFKMASIGRSAEDIANYLADIAADYMGLGPSVEGEIAAVETAAEILGLTRLT